MKKILSAVSLVLVVSFTQSQTQTDYPAATKQPVSSKYQGITVTEEYRWLEDFDAPAVKEWNREQNLYTRSYLDAIPFRAPSPTGSSNCSKISRLRLANSSKPEERGEQGGCLR